MPTVNPSTLLFQSVWAFVSRIRKFTLRCLSEEERNDLWEYNPKRNERNRFTHIISTATLHPSGPVFLYRWVLVYVNCPQLEGSGLPSRRTRVASSKDSSAKMPWKIRVDKCHVAFVHQPVESFKIVRVFPRIGPNPHCMPLRKFT